MMDERAGEDLGRLPDPPGRGQFAKRSRVTRVPIAASRGADGVACAAGETTVPLAQGSTQVIGMFGNARSCGVTTKRWPRGPKPLRTAVIQP